MNYLETKDKIKIAALVFILVAIIVLFSKISALYITAESFLKGTGLIEGPLIFALVIIILILITPMPISPFAFIGGLVFGHVLGFMTTLISAVLGACIAFLIGRYILGDYFAKKFKKHPIYKKMLEEEHKHLLKFIFLSRLIPKAPFELISYLAGTTTMKVWKFSLVTTLGMLPIVFVLSFFGEIVEQYRIMILIIFSIGFVIYLIYKIIKKKRYYVKGY